MLEVIRQDMVPIRFKKFGKCAFPQIRYEKLFNFLSNILYGYTGPISVRELKAGCWFTSRPTYQSVADSAFLAPLFQLLATPGQHGSSACGSDVGRVMLPQSNAQSTVPDALRYLHHTFGTLYGGKEI